MYTQRQNKYRGQSTTGVRRALAGAEARTSPGRQTLETHRRQRPRDAAQPGRPDGARGAAGRQAFQPHPSRSSRESGPQAQTLQRPARGGQASPGERWTVNVGGHLVSAQPPGAACVETEKALGASRQRLGPEFEHSFPVGTAGGLRWSPWLLLANSAVAGLSNATHGPVTAEPAVTKHASPTGLRVTSSALSSRRDAACTRKGQAPAPRLSSSSVPGRTLGLITPERTRRSHLLRNPAQRLSVTGHSE